MRKNYLLLSLCFLAFAAFPDAALDESTLHVPAGTKNNFNFEPWSQMQIIDDAEEEVINENPYIVNTLYEGRQRQYMVYRPKGNMEGDYDGVLVTCHGFGGKMSNALPIYGFQAAADELNMLVISPQALPEEDEELQNTADRVGYDLSATWGQVLYVDVTAKLGSLTLVEEKATFNENLNDIEFIRHLIQTNAAKYNADLNNVFIGGISMGGYLAYGYALRYGNELAGIINITGSMGLSVDTTNVTASLPILDFHSTTDATVFYEGEGNYGKTTTLDIYMKNAIPKLEVLNYWARKNGISTPPVETDLGTSRNVSFKKIHYQEEGKPEILHYQLTGADHGYNLTSADPVTQSAEIKAFIARHKKTDGEQPSKTQNARQEALNCEVSDHAIYIDGLEQEEVCRIYNLSGCLVKSMVLYPNKLNVIPIDELSSGIHVLQVASNGVKFKKN